MKPLDQKDPLDRLLDKELRGEAILFDEWEQAMDELADEPDFEEVLLREGLTWASARQQAEAYRQEFLRRAAQYALSLDDRLLLCQALFDRAVSPSNELRWLFCQIVTDTGFLLDRDREAFDEEELVQGWLWSQEESGELFAALAERAALQQRFLEICAQTQKNSLPKADCDSEKKDLIFQRYTALFGASGDEKLFLDNIEQLIGMQERSEALTEIAPLFLYRMLVRHSRRLHESDCTRFDFRALWRYQAYRIDGDNGKNYKTNLAYLRLFHALCAIYEKDARVSIPLCCHGFAQLSNLGDFYRMVKPADCPLPFAEPLEELIAQHAFSCYEHGLGDNVILAEEGLTARALFEFESGGDRNRARALDRISAYMNRNVAAVTTAFLDADAVGVKALCGEILTGAALTAREQPRDLHEVALFLASINGGLMELVDYYANDLLTRAAERLTGLTPAEEAR